MCRPITHFLVSLLFFPLALKHWYLRSVVYVCVFSAFSYLHWDGAVGSGSCFHSLCLRLCANLLVELVYWGLHRQVVLGRWWRHFSPHPWTWAWLLWEEVNKPKSERGDKHRYDYRDDSVSHIKHLLWQTASSGGVQSGTNRTGMTCYKITTCYNSI